MEKLDYMIRSLQYKRSCCELQLRKVTESHSLHGYLKGQIEGLNVALNLAYSLTETEE